MNIPQDTLQQVADAAFQKLIEPRLNTKPYILDWPEEAASRRAVIQHALDNPALAPFLAGGIGEYTDSDIHCAWRKAVESDDKFVDRIRAFLAAIPRHESQALVDLKSDLDGWKDRAVSLEGQVNEAITRAEKAEAELAGFIEAANEESRKNHVRNSQLANKLEGAQAELAALKSAELGILRPIAEMPETVPEGCMAVFRWRDDFGSWVTGTCEPTNGFFTILRLPDAEATPQAQADPYDELKAAHASGKVIQRDLNADADNEDWRDEDPDWKSHPTCYRIKPEPAAQVPLGPEDVPPGSVFTFGAKALWITPLCVSSDGVGFPDTEPNKPLIQRFSFDLLQEAAKINTSIPDTGRWDANAWRPCSKPGK